MGSGAVSGLNEEQIDQFWSAIETPAQLEVDGKRIFAGGNCEGASWTRVLDNDIHRNFRKEAGHILPGELNAEAEQEGSAA